MIIKSLQSWQLPDDQGQIIDFQLTRWSRHDATAGSNTIPNVPRNALIEKRLAASAS
jgi:hypothetical protein